jgi:enoyl-CoA hydratase/carnithine racemase
MIGVERIGAVTTIELQRPQRRNALNTELVDTLRDAVVKAAADDVRAIVLTGAGTVFCAGADLSGEELSVRVVPKQADEFTCSSCFLVHHRSRLAKEKNGEMICTDCAA